MNSKPPTIPFGVVECTLFDNLSRNSCKKTWGSYIVGVGERETGRFDTSRCDALEMTRILITSSIACAWTRKTFGVSIRIFQGHETIYKTPQILPTSFSVARGMQKKTEEGIFLVSNASPCEKTWHKHSTKCIVSKYLRLALFKFGGQCSWLSV